MYWSFIDRIKAHDCRLPSGWTRVDSGGCIN